MPRGGAGGCERSQLRVALWSRRHLQAVDRFESPQHRNSHETAKIAQENGQN